jgi:hypothetical protein
MIPKTLTETLDVNGAPIFVLTALEYLLLKMATDPMYHPGYYLNALDEYFNKKNFSKIFDLEAKYFGYEHSTRYYRDMSHVNSTIPIYMLTPSGMRIAVAAAQKIGVKLTQSI